MIKHFALTLFLSPFILIVAGCNCNDSAPHPQLDLALNDSLSKDVGVDHIIDNRLIVDTNKLDMLNNDAVSVDSTSYDRSINDQFVTDTQIRDASYDSTQDSYHEEIQIDGSNKDLLQHDAPTVQCDPTCRLLAPELCVKDPLQKICVQCLSDAHCQANPSATGGFCNLNSNTCICRSDQECLFNDFGSSCDTTSGQCYCQSDSDCSSPSRCIGERGGLKICSLPCKTNGDCEDPHPLCDTSSGKCIDCKVDSDCDNQPQGGQCDQGQCKCSNDSHCVGQNRWGSKCQILTGRCSCQSNIECTTSAYGPTCKTQAEKCGCNNDSSCPTTTRPHCALPYASADFTQCMEPCITDSECASLTFHLCVNGKCGQCRDDKDCSALSNPFCDPNTNRCVQCTSDLDCAGGSYNFCNSSTGRCTECVTNSDCTKDRPFCTDGTCKECLVDGDCASQPFGTVCSTGNCRCGTASDCLGPNSAGPICLSSKMCGCNDNQDCSNNSGGKTCSPLAKACSCQSDSDCTYLPSAQCTLPFMDALYSSCKTACTASTDCESSSGLYACDITTSNCVGCLSDSDCADNGQYIACRLSDNRCVQCQTNSHCTSIPFLPACHQGSGNCVECLTDADCDQNSLGSTCRGYVCECANDAQCANNEVGHRCSSDLHICFCENDSQCPAGKTCSGRYLGVSICR